MITVNGVPAAQLGPLNAGADAASLDDLVAAGLHRPRTTAPPAQVAPAAAPPGPTSTEILREHRDR